MKLTKKQIRKQLIRLQNKLGKQNGKADWLKWKQEQGRINNEQ